MSDFSRDELSGGVGAARAAAGGPRLRDEEPFHRLIVQAGPEKWREGGTEGWPGEGHSQGRDRGGGGSLWR